MAEVYAPYAQPAPTLTSWAVGWKAPGFIADQILPVVLTDDQKGEYPIFGPESLQVQDGKADKDGGGAEGEYATETGDFKCLGQMFSEWVANDNRPAPSYNRLLGATRRSLHKIKMWREKEVYDAVLSATNVPNVVEVENPWMTDNAPVDAATIEPDLFAAHDKIEADCGESGNLLVLSKAAFRAMQIDPDIREMAGVKNNFNNSSAATVRLEHIAAIAEVDRVLVARAIMDTATDGGTPVIQRVWPDDEALLVYQDPSFGSSPGIDIEDLTPSFGVQATWRRPVGAGDGGYSVIQSNVPMGLPPFGRGTGGGTYVTTSHYSVPLITWSGAGCRLTGLVTTS